MDENAKIWKYLEQYQEKNGLPVFVNRMDFLWALGKELIKNEHIGTIDEYKYFGQQQLKAPYNQSGYIFLVDSELLGNNIIYLTVSGSRAYGTETTDSDYDLRGGFIENTRSLLSLEQKQEEFIDSGTDTCIYSFKKWMKLLASCNPNVIEMLGTRAEDVIYMTDIGKQIRDNRHLFLSKRAFSTFAGYATQQLRRLQNALARDSYPQSEKERHILKSINMDILTSSKPFNAYLLDEEQTNNNGSVFDVTLDVQPTENGEFEQEIFLDGTMKHIPLREFLKLNSKMANTIKNYGLLTQRNKKKDEAHLNKHAMHLIRLYYMGIDILRNQEIVTYREKEHDLLMSIRNGEMALEKVFELQERLEKDMFDAFENTKLPATPDMAAINDLIVGIYEKFLIKR